MIGKKINQLATELAPDSTDLTIIGDPISGVSKKITLAQLGAIFSGAVSFYTNLAAFPVTGDINVIYCAKDTQKLYLWSGSAYVEVFPSQALLNTYQLRSEKGVSNGYASLDSAGKVPIAQLPSSIMEYKGTWNAATNTPTLANGTGDTGDVYICNVAGTVNFGAGAITFAVGDYVIYSGTIWQRSSGAVGTVTSVGLSSATSGVTIGSTPITTSGTITLAIATASGSAQGLLSSTDWTTFNSKQNALTNPVTGTGASGQVTFFNGTSTVTGSNNHFWDATNNRLGIGLVNPQRSIEIFNSTADNHLRLSGNAPSVSMGEAVTGSIYQAKFGLVTVNGQFVTAGVAGDFVIISQTGATIIGTSSTEKMRVQSSGNVSINNTNDTFKLDVTGTARLTGQLRLESTITDGTNTYTLPSATGTLALTSALSGMITGTGTTNYLPKFTGASTIGNSQVFDNGTNVGINNTSPAERLSVAGAIMSTGGITGHGANRTTISQEGGSGAFWQSYGADASTVGTFTLRQASSDFSIVRSPLVIASTGAATFSSTIKSSDTYGFAIGSIASFRRIQYGSDNATSFTLLTDANGYAGLYAGAATFSSTIAATSATFSSSVTATSFNGTTNNIFSVSGTEGMRLTSTGLGIGTTAPAYPLQVRRAGGGGSLGISIDGVGSTDRTVQYFAIQDSASGAGAGHAFYYRPPSSTTDTLGFILDENGSIGIGTTSPSVALQVDASGGGIIRATRLGAGSAYVQLEADGTNGTLTSSAALIMNAGGSERMRITSGGNVGIGTTAPGSLFEINKSSNSGSGSTFPRLAIKNTLATQGDGSSTFNFADILISSGNESVNMFLSTTYAAGTWAPAGIINVSTNHDLQFKTNNTERMRITSGGNVLIGTTSDTGQKLIVSGNININGLATTTGKTANSYYMPIYLDNNLYYLPLYG